MIISCQSSETESGDHFNTTDTEELSSEQLEQFVTPNNNLSSDIQSQTDTFTSQVQWEECEIVPITQSIPMSAAPNMVPINFTYLWFQATTHSGGSATVLQPEESDQISPEELSSGIIEETPRRQAMLESLKQQLISNSWEQVGQGEDWYNLKFRRAVRQ